MTLQAADLEAIRRIVREEICALLPEPNSTTPAAFVPHRLTVAEFAFCVQRCQDQVRRWIRANRHGIRSRRLAFGPPYLVDPRALDLFGVSSEVALCRLAEFRAAAVGKL